MSDCVLALTTLPETADAAALGRALVDAGVAACVTVLPPVESIYRWEGAVHADRERQLLIKTTRDRVAALWTALRERHPYQVPEFIVVPIVDGNPDYVNWIRASVAGSS